MADRTISQLPAVTAMGVTDLFVLEQAGAAKKLTGQLLKTSLLAWLDGHGGVNSFAYDEDTGKVTIVTTDGTSLTTGDLRGKNGHMIHSYDLPGGSSPGSFWIRVFSSADPMPEDWALGDYVLTDSGEMFTISEITPEGDGYEVRFDFVVSLSGPQGDSPTIGSNGHWWVGTTDTGVTARGDTGTHGSDVSVAFSIVAGTTAHPKGGTKLTITETVYDETGAAAQVNTVEETIWNGEDGSSIQSINRTSGTGAPGTTDTYTVTLTDGSTTTFMVYNGRDGDGSGDMTQAVYDPQGKAQDIFAYADAIQTALNTALTAHADNVSLHTSDAEKAVWNGKADVPTPLSVLLMASGWDANTKEQTVSVSDMTASANILVSAAPASFMAYAQAGIRCTAQSAGALTFACETVPEEAVTANVIILG